VKKGILLSAILALGLALPTLAANLSNKLPLEIPGGDFGSADQGGKKGIRGQMAAKAGGGGEETPEGRVLSRKVNFRSSGVWYLWLKVRSEGSGSSLLSYDLDGVQALHSARGQILVQPQPGSQWLSYSRFPGFKIEVHVSEAGNHVLDLRLLQGAAKVEKILATLYYSAEMKEDGVLDHSQDPGRGRAHFGESPLPKAGFREDFHSPEIQAGGRSVYVDSEKGNDAHDGSSPQEAWKSLARVNAEVFQPGDAILLKRGGRWNEGLAPRGNGSAEAWIHLGAYGEGPRPWINGISKPGLSLKDQSWWQVQDLQVTSDPEYEQDGLSAGLSPGAPRPRGLKVTDCLAFDNGGSGFDIGGGQGYDGVEVVNCLSFCNGDDGIQVWGETQKSCRNTVIRSCTAYSNPGQAGIWINGGENGLIEDCVAYNNSTVNLWAWNAVNVTMRRCEAFRGRPPADAAGFDIDWGSQACTLEYCYSHQNEGDAFLLMGSGEGKYNGYSMHSDYNLMRFCVSEGGNPIDLIETFQHGKIYNNLSMAWSLEKEAVALDVGGWIDKSSQDTGLGGGWPSDNEVADNLFVGLEGASGSWVDDRATSQGNRFHHNLYWMVQPSGPVWRWGGKRNGPGFWEGDAESGSKAPEAYSKLEDLQKATGQESGGILADPLLNGAGWGEMGRLPLEHGRLKVGSPALGAGKKVVLDQDWLRGRRAYLTETGAEAYGIPMDPAEPREDYWGGKLEDSRWPIGPDAGK
jgi:hypothetical protein